MPRRIPHYLTRSVRGRLILLVAALILPVVALTGTMILQSYRNERLAIARMLLSMSRTVSGVIDAKLDEADSVLAALAASNALDRDDLADFDRQARRAIDREGYWFVLLDPDGQQRINTGVPGTQNLPRTDVDEATLRALQRGETYVSNLHKSRATGRLVAHVSRPYFRHGRLTYILSMSITPAALARAIDVVRYAPGKIVTLIDRDGVIIARSLNPQQFVGASATPDMVAATAQHAEGTVDSVTLERIPVVVAFSRSIHGWSTLIGAPKTELYLSARSLLMWSVVGSALLILVAVFMALWIGRALVRSADVLESDAVLLGRGEMPPDVSTGLDETDFVASSMRRTARTLLERTHTLEVLNRISAELVAERNVEAIVQAVTDAGRELTGAELGASYFRTHQAPTDSLQLLTVSQTAGTIPTARDLVPIAPALREMSAVRSGDLRIDPRLDAFAPLFRVLDPSSAFRSCLAVPVASRTGEMVGWFIFAHSTPNRFSQEVENTLVGLTAEAAIAVDNAKLYHALARELEAKSKAEADLRVAQDRLHEHARDLEQKVDERTASLRDAVAQMEEFSYTVSHDLRGPLRAMHAFAGALAEDYGPQLDDTARDYIRRIQRASQRMDQLTTNLLSYSRVARADVQLQPIDLERLVRSTIDHYPELQPPVAAVTVVSPLAPVLAHEPSLMQCLANLLTNASKFVKPGQKPKITIRTETRISRVRLWIEDEGIGIAPEYQRSLFRIFERVPNSMNYEGTGVGLAIVRKAVEKMGGSCGVESDGQNGSRFWIELHAVPPPEFHPPAGSTV